MKTEKKLLTEITRLTTSIETNYPELYKHLEEIPLTIPSEDDPEITIRSLQDYLESLKQLLKHHLETHKHKK